MFPIICYSGKHEIIGRKTDPSLPQLGDRGRGWLQRGCTRYILGCGIVLYGSVVEDTWNGFVIMHRTVYHKMNFTVYKIKKNPKQPGYWGRGRVQPMAVSLTVVQVNHIVTWKSKGNKGGSWTTWENCRLMTKGAELKRCILVGCFSQGYGLIIPKWLYLYTRVE